MPIITSKKTLFLILIFIICKRIDAKYGTTILRGEELRGCT